MSSDVQEALVALSHYTDSDIRTQPDCSRQSKADACASRKILALPAAHPLPGQKYSTRACMAFIHTLYMYVCIYTNTRIYIYAYTRIGAVAEGDLSLGLRGPGSREPAPAWQLQVLGKVLIGSASQLLGSWRSHVACSTRHPTHVNAKQGMRVPFLS